MEYPLMIFIVGTTAVGKTKLSLELCKRIGGQIVNCDSKQLYKYANIMTAKPNFEQRKMVPHHMLDRLELTQKCYNRNKYFNEAMKSISEIKLRGKIPVIVGGTNYYLQTLLYNVNMESNYRSQLNLQGNEKQNPTLNQLQQAEDQNQQQESKQQSPKLKQNTNLNELQKLKQSLLHMNSQQKYAQLKKVDPKMAEKLHQNDEFRITNFLTRYVETGVPPSLSYQPFTHQLRQSNTLLFWVKNQNKTELHELMKKRIDEMVNEGLLETLSMLKYAEMNGLLTNMKMGVLQSIGYKQFHDLYQQVRHLLIDQHFDEKPREFLQIQQFVQDKMKAVRQHLFLMGTQSTTLQNCKDILLKNTIAYSKRQVKWMRNRLFSCQQNSSNFFVLYLAKSNSNNDLMVRFEQSVQKRALDIVNLVKANGIGVIKENQKQFIISKHEGLKEWKKYYCQKCQVEANGSHEWEEHLLSRKHLQTKSKKNKKYIKAQLEKQSKNRVEQIHGHSNSQQSNIRKIDSLQNQQR